MTRREIIIGARIWLVDTVEDQDALLRAAETNAQFPFGLMLWESAIALAEALNARAPSLQGKSVLELGAGLGLSGVVAASLGATVTQTDHAAAALTACGHTAFINGIVGIEYSRVDWHAWHGDIRYDLILGADIIYDGYDHAALIALFERCLLPTGHILLADPGRKMQGLFVTRAEAAGWGITRTNWAICEFRPPNAGARLPIDILELQRMSLG